MDKIEFKRKLKSKNKMMKQQYRQENGVITGVIGEEDFKRFSFERFNIDVVITKTLNDSYGGSYFNVYILDDRFKIEPLNNLNENISLENEPKDWENYLLKRLCEHIIWRDYNYNVAIIELEDNN